MTKLDIGILILVGLAGISCCRAGFTRSVWGVFVIGLGFFIACQFWSQLAMFLQKFVKDPAWAKWLSIVAIVLTTSILVDSLFERIQRILEKGVLGWVNRLLGLCFGIASGGLVIACHTYLTQHIRGATVLKTRLQILVSPHNSWTSVITFGRSVKNMCKSNSIPNENHFLCFNTI